MIRQLQQQCDAKQRQIEQLQRQEAAVANAKALADEKAATEAHAAVTVLPSRNPHVSLYACVCLGIISTQMGYPRPPSGRSDETQPKPSSDTQHPDPG